MQYAYDKKMKNTESPRRARRRIRLDELVLEVGSAAQIARECEIPKSHISAMQAGRRGLGDDLAKRLETRYKKPEGWFDGVPSTGNSSSDGQESAPLPGVRGGGLRAAIDALALALVAIDPVDRAAAKAYLAGLCDAPDRVDLRERICTALEPPTSHQVMPETGAKRIA